jgi:hypothetical protein
MNPINLGNYITNPVARKAIYSTYGIVAFIAAGIQVGFLATPDAGQPIWLTVSLAVIAFLGAPIGTLAASNSPTPNAIAASENK